MTIGDKNPIAVQTMTNCSTRDTSACLEQIGRIRAASGRIVRLTAQGRAEVDNLEHIASQCHAKYPDVVLVADIHFVPELAELAAHHVDKVRINPGNYTNRNGNFERLIELCNSRGVALRIGVNHGSLSQRIVDRLGDSPAGMVESAMEFLRECKRLDFANAVVSMKSSNTRVMLYAYRLLVEQMQDEGMSYPIHLGVTEAGNGIEGRIRSAVGIGAVLADGIGDTLRVSLTEAPENEIPVARKLVQMFERRNAATIERVTWDDLPSPFDYRPRTSSEVETIGGNHPPVIYGELSEEQLHSIDSGKIALLTAHTDNPVKEWRSAIAEIRRSGDRRPIILHKRYRIDDAETMAIEAAADFGVMFLDSLADGLWIECDRLPAEYVNQVALDILQASRVRVSRAEYIACPGCGRTLYDIESALAQIKSRTDHLTGIKIAVMGCIVNGPGEMADADYGYVGAGAGRVSLYRAGVAVERNIPQQQAVDKLVELIRRDNRWHDR